MRKLKKSSFKRINKDAISAAKKVYRENKKAARLHRMEPHLLAEGELSLHNLDQWLELNGCETTRTIANKLDEEECKVFESRIRASYALRGHDDWLGCESNDSQGISRPLLYIRTKSGIISNNVTVKNCKRYLNEWTQGLKFETKFELEEKKEEENKGIPIDMEWLKSIWTEGDGASF